MPWWLLGCWCTLYSEGLSYMITGLIWLNVPTDIIVSLKMVDFEILGWHSNSIQISRASHLLIRRDSNLSIQIFWRRQPSGIVTHICQATVTRENWFAQHILASNEQVKALISIMTNLVLKLITRGLRKAELASCLLAVGSKVRAAFCHLRPLRVAAFCSDPVFFFVFFAVAVVVVVVQYQPRPCSTFNKLLPSERDKKITVSKNMKNFRLQRKVDFSRWSLFQIFSLLLLLLVTEEQFFREPGNVDNYP